MKGLRRPVSARHEPGATEPPGPSMNRISPDTDLALRVPTLEDLPTPTPVLGQIQGNHDVVGHREPMVRELRRDRPSIARRAYCHLSGWRHPGRCPVGAEHGPQFALVLQVEFGGPVCASHHRSLVPDGSQGPREAEKIGVGLGKCPQRSPRRSPGVGHFVEQVGDRWPTLAVHEAPVPQGGQDLRDTRPGDRPISVATSVVRWVSSGWRSKAIAMSRPVGTKRSVTRVSSGWTSGGTSASICTVAAASCKWPRRSSHATRPSARTRRASSEIRSATMIPPANLRARPSASVWLTLRRVSTRIWRPSASTAKGDRALAGTARAPRDWTTSSAGLFVLRAGTNPEYHLV